MIALDGTPTKSRLGANALLGVSMAALRAEARRSKHAALRAHRRARTVEPARFTLPVPMMNILNGGAHADSSVDFQEFMVMPVGAPSFAEALRAGAEIFHALRGILKSARAVHRRRRRRRLRAEPEIEPRSGRSRARSDRQGRAARPATTSSSRSTSRRASSGPAAARYVVQEIRRARPHVRRRWSSSTPTGCRQYPIISIEDGVAEGDWDGWKLLTQALGGTRAAGRRRCVRDQPGDPQARASPTGVGNALLVKLNQIGTVTETLDAVRDGARRRLRDDHLAPLRRNRGLDDRRPRGRHRAPARSRPARRAAPIASANTTSCCASKRSSARRDVYAGRAAIRALARA